MSQTNTRANPNASLIIIVGAFSVLILTKGANFLGIRFAVQTIPPFMMAGVRYTLAGGLLLVGLLIRGVPLPTRAQVRASLLVSSLMVLVGNASGSYIQQFIPSGLAALIVGSAPVWVTLVEWLLFGGEGPNAQVVIGLLVGFVGIALLLDPAGYAEGWDFKIGILLAMLAGTIVWATGWTYSRHADMPANPLMKSAWVMFVGGLELLLLSLVTGEPARLDVPQLSANSLLSLAYLIVFGSMVMYTVMLWLMQTVQPTLVATSNYVSPVISLLLGWLVAGEVVTTQAGIAAAVIVLGVVLITSRSLRRVRIQPAISEAPPPC